jgi:phosphate transport system permease protein
MTIVRERPVAEPDVERRVRIHRFTREGALSVLGAALGALGMVWVLYERILPFRGALGFWVCWYVAFLLFYAGIAALQWDRMDVRDRVAGVALGTVGLLTCAIVFDQVLYTVIRGREAVQHSSFFTKTMAFTGPLDPLTQGGALHAMLGSLEQLGLATLFSVPLGIVAALFLAEVGGRWARPVRVIVEAMTALPDVIAGLFILALVILTLGLEKSGLAASLALAVTMMPIVTRASEVVIRIVPGTLREASYALGSSQWRTVWHVVLPTARSGLATAVVLAMARGIGETAPVLLTAGVTKELNLDPLHGPQMSLPLYIWNYVRYPQPAMVVRAFGCGLTLIIVVLVLFAIARMLGGAAPGELTRRQRRRAAMQEIRP